jgi:hypothetical protein
MPSQAEDGPRAIDVTQGRRCFLEDILIFTSCLKSDGQGE